MERIDQLEKDVAEVKSDIAVIKSNYVTKADLHDSVNGLIKWIVGTAVGLGAAGITIMTFVLNNAIPKAPPTPAAQPAPIVITLPAGATTPAPPSPK